MSKACLKEPPHIQISPHCSWAVPHLPLPAGATKPSLALAGTVGAIPDSFGLFSSLSSSEHKTRNLWTLTGLCRMCRNWNSHWIPKQTNQYSLQKSSTGSNWPKNKTLRKEKSFWAQHLFTSRAPFKRAWCPKGSLFQFCCTSKQHHFSEVIHNLRPSQSQVGFIPKPFTRRVLPISCNQAQNILCAPPSLCWDLSRNIIPECFCSMVDNCMFDGPGSPNPDRGESLSTRFPLPSSWSRQFSLTQSSSHAVLGGSSSCSFCQILGFLSPSQWRFGDVQGITLHRTLWIFSGHHHWCWSLMSIY